MNEQPIKEKSQESEKELFTREIRAALSLFPKSIQELLPHYFPENKSTNEMSKEELEKYRLAYGIVAEMVDREEAESVLVENSQQPNSFGIEGEFIGRQKFKKPSLKGKKETKDQISWQGGLATNESF